MRSPHRCSLLLLSALWLSAPELAHAEDVANRRVLLVEQGRDPFLEQVGAEVEKLGFTLVRTDASGPLEATARAEHALCAIRLLPSRTGVEVWMADATSGRSLLRQVVVDERPGGPDRDLIALQTAELLRTSLVGDNSAPEQRQPTPAASVAAPPAPAPTQPAATHDMNTGIALAVGALYSPGGATASIVLGLSLQRYFAERWGVGLDLSMPISSSTIRGIEGSVQLRPYFAGISLLGRLPQHASPFFASAGAGISLLLVEYDADTHEPLHSRAGHQLMQALYLRADVGLQLASWLRLGVRALAGACAQQLSLDFAGNDAGNFGPALFAGFAFVEVDLP